MKNLQLYERFVLKSPKTAQEVLHRLRELGAHDAMMGLLMMYHWFSGRMMASDNEMHDVVDLFRKISKVYHEKTDGDVYRAVHIRLPRAGMSDEEIMKIKKAQTGPKKLQSWSTTQKGAEWFLNHFAFAQNQHDEPHPTKAWVIVKTDVKNLDQFMTYEECMKFMVDIDTADLHPEAHALVQHYYSNDMMDLEELIALTPEDCPIEIVKVVLPPIRHKQAA